jgi:hypothetical protein
VVPPSGFKFRSLDIEGIKNLTIPRPLEQQVQVGRGFFDLKLMQRKAMLVRDYKNRVDRDSRAVRGMSTEQVEKIVSSPVLAGHRQADPAVRRGREGQHH